MPYFAGDPSCLLKQRLYLLAVDSGEADKRHRAADDFRDGEGQPDPLHLARQAQQIGHREQYHQLTAQGNNSGINAVAQRLKAGAQRNADGRNGEAPADGAQSDPADLQKRLRGVEQSQQQIREELEYQQTRRHDTQRRGAGDFQRFCDPLGLAGAIVVGDDGNGGVVQAEQGHEEEALELEIHTEHAGRRLGEALQNLVDAEIHHRANAVHNDGGNAHRQNGGHGLALQRKILLVQLYLRVEFQVENDDHDAGHPLADHRVNGRAGNAHGGQTEPSVDENGVENDVDDRADGLGNHGMHRPAGGLQQPLAQNGCEAADAEHAADAGVDNAALHGFRVGGLNGKVGTHAEQTEQHEQHHGNGHQHDAVSGGAVGGLLIFLTQTLGKQGVDAHADAHGEADQQVLDGEGQRQRRHRALRHLRNVDAVNHVVKRLHQHGYDHGQRHVGDQLPDGHDAHFVFL